MSLSTSLANAFSGLTVTARSAQLVSSNLANALNENYSRQTLELGTMEFGGASVSGTPRFVDRALTSDRRTASAEMELSQERLKHAQAIEAIIGLPDDPSSISAHINAFDSSLRFLESDSGSDVRLRDLLSSAKALTNRLATAESDIQTQRQRADTQIAMSIESLNANLRQIVELNEEIVSANVNGRDANMLLDQRQALVDQVSALVPVREMRQRFDAISLVTANGTMLVQDSEVSIDFTPTNLIMPHMTVQSGDLGTLEIEGDHVSASRDGDPLAGGRLQALFEIRDSTAPDHQTQLDAFALDLANRFHDLASDTTIVPGDPGLFTDNNARATDPIGLAGRLSINTNVDPESGGELWRLRSGLQAASENAKGDATLVSEMIGVLGQNDATFGTAFNHGATLSTDAAFKSATVEQQQTFASVQYEQLTQLHRANGVDSDAELQKLLLIERNYAANAKVMQAIDEMFSAIMRIG